MRTSGIKSKLYIRKYLTPKYNISGSYFDQLSNISGYNPYIY